MLPVLDRSLREQCAPWTSLLVFLGGSAVHGDLCGIEAPEGRRRFLSDLDLGIVTDRRIPLEDRERIAAILRGVAGEGPEVAVGFYCRDDLRKQLPTPGMVETVRHGYALSGDAGLLDCFEMPPPEEIPAREARRLLANRVLEWLGASGVSPEPLAIVYAAAKLHSDAATIRLIAARTYAGGGLEARAMALAALHAEPEERARIDAWTAWRRDPSWRSVPAIGSVDRAGEAEGRAVLAAEARDTVRRTVTAIAGTEDAGEFLTSARVRWRAWGRSWKRWSRIRPASLRRARKRELARTPRLLLWEAALERVLGRPDACGKILGRLLGGRDVGPDRADAAIAELARQMERAGVD